MDKEVAGFEVALILIGAFRRMVDQLHADLAEQGYPEARPGHGFALQAIGPGQVSISELSRRLGVTKQAASKTVRQLEEIGYVTRIPDPADARATLVGRSQRGNDLLRMSAACFDRQKADWQEELGTARFADAMQVIRMMSGETQVTDVGSWLQES